MRQIANIHEILNIPEHESEIKERATLFRKGESMKLRIFDFMAIVQNPGVFPQRECIRVLEEMIQFEEEMHEYFKQLRAYMSGRMIEDE